MYDYYERDRDIHMKNDFETYDVFHAVRKNNWIICWNGNFHLIEKCKQSDDTGMDGDRTGALSIQRIEEMKHKIIW